MANTLNLSNQRGPLRVSAENPRYFTDNSGRAILLAGFHTWYNVQDGGGTDPPGAFDWDEYASALVSYGCNFTKLWASMETAQLWADPFGTVQNPQYFSPTRYGRTGPGNAADGGLKFNLDQINQEFLTRLVQRAADCSRRGIYVVIQFFQGWQIDTKGGSDNPWTYHPYDSANNINSVDGDDDNDGEGTETHTDTNNNVLTYQQALVSAIVGAVNHLDNVIYEISNEDTGSAANTNWQEGLIDYIEALEASLPKQHPIGRTVCYPSGSNTDLDNSDAVWVSYNGDKADDAQDGTKVAIRDSDHVEGIATDRSWIWPGFCNGSGGVWYMDPWAGEVYGTDTRNNATYQNIRANLGYVLTLTRRLSLLEMTPQPSLSTTNYCLAKNHATAAHYVCYQPGSGAFNLDLSTATRTLR